MAAHNSESVARVEDALEQMKEAPEIYLEWTRHYVQPDPEDAGSVYDTCDVLGPWDTLNPTEKLAALHELDWQDVSPDDKRRIIEREVDLSQVTESAQQRFFGDILGNRQPTDYQGIDDFDRALSESANRGKASNKEEEIER